MSWSEKFENFEHAVNWIKVTNTDKPKHKLNEYRTVLINYKLYYEVKTQKPDITFLIDIKNFHLLQNYTWHCVKNANTYYLQTSDKKKQLLHRMIHPEYKMIDHKNRNGLDNRGCKL